MDPEARTEHWGFVVRAGAVYFLVVFAAGFVLGVVRTLWVVPALGTRWAELIEMPVMLVVVLLAARGVVRRFALPERPRAAAVGVGMVALGLLVGAELTIVLALRGESVVAYFAARDPVAGTAYALSLLVFAAAPAVVAARIR